MIFWEEIVFSPRGDSLRTMNAAGRLPGWQFSRNRQLFQSISSWKGVLMGWGVVAGVAAVFLVERIPAFRRDVFSKIPLIGDRWAEYRVHEEEESADNE